MSGVAWGFTHDASRAGVKLGDTAKKIAALSTKVDGQAPRIDRDAWVDLLITARYELALLVPPRDPLKRGG